MLAVNVAVVLARSITPLRSAAPCSMVGIALGPPMYSIRTMPLPSSLTFFTKLSKFLEKYVPSWKALTAFSTTSAAWANLGTVATIRQTAKGSARIAFMIAPGRNKRCDLEAGNHRLIYISVNFHDIIIYQWPAKSINLAIILVKTPRNL